MKPQTPGGATLVKKRSEFIKIGEVKEPALSIRDPIILLSIGGVLCIVLCLVVGTILAEKKVNKSSSAVESTICQLDYLGYDLSSQTKPWEEAANPQFMFSIILTIVFILRKFVFKPLSDRLYPQLIVEKKIKCANYMLELVGDTAAIVVPSVTGYWLLLFMPDQFSSPMTPNESHRLAVQCQTYWFQHILLKCRIITTFELVC
jgi:hypothetical protein